MKSGLQMRLGHCWLGCHCNHSIEPLQVLQQEGVRLLMCAPKNFSADLLCSALGQAGITKQAMLRLNDPRHPPPQVTALLQSVLCNGQPAQGSC